MHEFLRVLGWGLIGIGLICNWIIVIDAIKSDELEGCMTLINGLWFFWYAWSDFEHDYRWPILAGAFVAPVVGALLLTFGR